MDLHLCTMENSIRLIKPIGKLDMIGVGEIEAKFTAFCAGDKVRLVVDLSEVDFLASIGIRLLTMTAKSVANRGGKLVLINAIPAVYDVLEVTGIPAIIPIYSHLESAETILMAS
jgi:anti-sigma B factor antagonist